jgi:hypothetical protein
LSGFSGFSGISGYSGFSGATGAQGVSGLSGFSGYSGSTGASGLSGFSGYSGSGISGFSGFSGFSGYSGSNGAAAWVNFNGTGTVAIRASFNVSSITDNGTGDYTVNFTNALADANYAAVVGVGNADGDRAGLWTDTFTTGSVRLRGFNASSSTVDMNFANCAIFR